jgi:hypothetical protein
MKKALIGYRRSVSDDGAIGGELVVALALAVPARRSPVMRIYEAGPDRRDVGLYHGATQKMEMCRCSSGSPRRG